jgi:hypothetical protein
MPMPMQATGHDHIGDCNAAMADRPALVIWCTTSPYLHRDTLG